MTAGRLGLVVALVGIVLVGVALAQGRQSVRDFLGDRCTPAGVQRDERGRKADAFRCRERPAKLAAALTDRHEPADRRTTPEGIFLRYRNDMVAVLGQGGGSRALVARERDGYGFFFPFVGGWWGTYGGPAETFRGGGPGAGK